MFNTQQPIQWQPNQPFDLTQLSAHFQPASNELWHQAENDRIRRVIEGSIAQRMINEMGNVSPGNRQAMDYRKSIEDALRQRDIQDRMQQAQRQSVLERNRMGTPIVPELQARTYQGVPFGQAPQAAGTFNGMAIPQHGAMHSPQGMPMQGIPEMPAITPENLASIPAFGQAQMDQRQMIADAHAAEEKRRADEKEAKKKRESDEEIERIKARSKNNRNFLQENLLKMTGKFAGTPREIPVMDDKGNVIEWKIEYPTPSEALGYHNMLKSLSDVYNAPQPIDFAGNLADRRMIDGLNIGQIPPMPTAGQPTQAAQKPMQAGMPTESARKAYESILKNEPQDRIPIVLENRKRLEEMGVDVEWLLSKLGGRG